MGRPTNRHRPRCEQLESRRPLAADLAALDVNHDTVVSPLDALLVINQINTQGSGSAVTLRAEAEGTIDCDTNSDGVVSAQDVLLVINQINASEVVTPVDPTQTTTTPVVDPVVVTPVVTTPTDPTATVPTDPTTTVPTDPTATVPTDPTATVPTDPTTTVPTDPTSSTPDDSSNDSDDDTTGDTPTTTPCQPGTSTGTGLQRGELGHAGHRGQRDSLLWFDANNDGVLTSDEVPESIWTELVKADADANGSVSPAEIKAYREAQRLAAVETFFAQLDKDTSGSITSSEVSKVAWNVLSRADADNNGEISLAEFSALAMLPPPPPPPSMVMSMSMHRGHRRF